MLKKVLKMLLKRRKKQRARKLHRNLLHLPLVRHPVPKIKVSNGHLKFSVKVHEEVNRLKVVTRIGHS